MKKSKVILFNILLIIIIITCFETFLNFRYRDNFNEKRVISLKEKPPNIDEFLQPSNSYINAIKVFNINKNLQQKDYRIRTNDNGFIIGEKNSIISPKKADAIFYGGSTTECLYVEESKRFPYLVQQRLNKRLNMDLVFLNSGVSGKSSIQSTFDFLAKGINLNPEFVFLMHNINDLSLLINTGSYWNAPKPRSIILEEKQISNFFQLALPNLSYVLKRVRSVIFPELVENIDEWENHRFNEMVTDEMIELEFSKSIENFIYIAKNNNINVILMTQFNRINFEDSLVYNNMFTSNAEEWGSGIDLDRMINLYSRFNEIIRSIAVSQDVDLIDLDLLVKPQQEFIYDQVHLNTKGSIFVAREIENFLLNNYYN